MVVPDAPVCKSVQDITAPIFWVSRANPNVSIIQVDPLSDIDDDLIRRYRLNHPQHRIVLTDMREVLHLSNNYSRSSTAEYLRAVLTPTQITNLQTQIDQHAVIDNIDDQIKLAYQLDIGDAAITPLLTMAQAVTHHQSDAALMTHVDLSPGFLSTIVARLYGTLTTSFYANGDITEAMVAQSILNYDLTPWSTDVRKHYGALCGVLSQRLQHIITSTTVPTLVIIDMVYFNMFVNNSCADRLIRICGGFDCGREASIGNSIDTLDTIYNSIKSDTNELITLLARIWVIDALMQACELVHDTTTIEHCKIAVVGDLLTHYMSTATTTDDHSDVYDLFSFYMGMSRCPDVAHRQHSAICTTVANLYRTDGYDAQATAVEHALQHIATPEPDGRTVLK